jgi:hypothetical protein
MTDANVIAFPSPVTSAVETDRFRDWLSWVECELAILGYELSACSYDWRAAHDAGLRPEVAAGRAVLDFETA